MLNPRHHHRCSVAGTLYATCSGSSQLIAVYPNATIAVVAAGDPLVYPLGVAFDPVARRLYASNLITNNIVSVSLAGQGAVYVPDSWGYINAADTLACDGAGNLYVSNHDGNNILKVRQALTLAAQYGIV
jgi:sugar lactone lactonase YvrE